MKTHGNHLTNFDRSLILVIWLAPKQRAYLHPLALTQKGDERRGRGTKMSPMKVVIGLESAVPAFDLRPSQLEALRIEYPRHDFVVAANRSDFFEVLPSAEA